MLSFAADDAEKLRAEKNLHSIVPNATAAFLIRSSFSLKPTYYNHGCKSGL